MLEKWPFFVENWVVLDVFNRHVIYISKAFWNL
jgi:hypothetical protein